MYFLLGLSAFLTRVSDDLEVYDIFLRDVIEFSFDAPPVPFELERRCLADQNVTVTKPDPCAYRQIG